jgi:release factor glutamine methyltransferase
MVKIFEAVKKAREIIKDVDTPQLDAEVILSHILGKERMYLHLNRDKVLNEAQINDFFLMIDRRKNREPVQYIVGSQEFMGLDFQVKKGILVPRGDTEILVEETLKLMEKIQHPIVVDVGCGSGAISVSIAKFKEDSKVYALDIENTPIEITRINAGKNDVGNRVKVIKSDMLEELDKDLEGNVDVIISNPPYIKDSVIPGLMEEVKDFEPYSALSGGEDGLFFYREITKQSLKFLKKDGIIAYEIGHDQREDVATILRDNGFYGIMCIKDFAGHDRVIIGWRK